MEYRYLGKSGVQVSNLCLGAMTFGQTFPLPESGTDEETSHKLLNRFVELGGNFVDTADIYNFGQSEEIVGRWLERQQRDNLVIATKVRHNMSMFSEKKVMNNVGLSRRHITEAIDRSLERLHTDYIDLYQTHIWDEAIPLEETMRTFDDLIRCGKVRYAGGSNLTGWQTQKLVETSKLLGMNPFVSLQQQYNLLCRWSELESFQVCKMEGLAVLPWSPLKAGLLTGKYKRNKTPTDGRLGWVAKDEKSRHEEISPGMSGLTEATFDIIETAGRIGKAKGKSTAQVAIRWLLQKDVVSSVIIGATKMSQLEDNMKAASGWTLSPEEMKQLDDVSQPQLTYPHEFVYRLNRDRKNPFSISQHVASTH